MSNYIDYLGSRRCCINNLSKTVVGPQGAQGYQGPIGFRGYQGSTGEGAQGATGPAGGPQGDIGATGAQGDTGAQGATGASQWVSMNGFGAPGIGYTGIGVTGQDVLIYGNLLVTGTIDPERILLQKFGDPEFMNLTGKGDIEIYGTSQSKLSFTTDGTNISSLPISSLMDLPIVLSSLRFPTGDNSANTLKVNDTIQFFDGATGAGATGNYGSIGLAGGNLLIDASNNIIIDPSNTLIVLGDLDMSGNNITNLNQVSAPSTDYKIDTLNRFYQQLDSDPSWNAVNGYYGLAKDAYPALNPYSSGVKAVSTWTTRTSASDNEWTSVCWSPELKLFVAVSRDGSGNRVMTSSDGIVWTARTSATDNLWSSVCWSPELSLFVAVAYSGIGNRVMTSPDGIVWTARISASDDDWSCVCWSPELRLFVAVSTFTGNNSNVMTSPNGIVWTMRASPDQDWSSVCWSPELSLFVAVAYSGTGDRVMTSPDGIVWTARNSATDNNWYAVCWSPELGLFIAVAYSGTGNRVMTSPDGFVWTSRTSAANNMWKDVCWSAELGLFVAVSSDGSGNKVMTSPDGITWTSRAVNNNGLTSVCWAPELGIFVAVAATGTGNRVITSSLLARPPTSYNVFDSSFNNIDQSGNWTFKTKSIYSDGNITIDPSNTLIVLGDLDMSGNNILHVNDISLNTINGGTYPFSLTLSDVLLAGNTADNSIILADTSYTSTLNKSSLNIADAGGSINQIAYQIYMSQSTGNIIDITNDSLYSWINTTSPGIGSINLNCNENLLYIEQINSTAKLKFGSDYANGNGELLLHIENRDMFINSPSKQFLKFNTSGYGYKPTLLANDGVIQRYMNYVLYDDGVTTLNLDNKEVYFDTSSLSDNEKVGWACKITNLNGGDVQLQNTDGTDFISHYSGIISSPYTIKRWASLEIILIYSNNIGKYYWAVSQY